MKKKPIKRNTKKQAIRVPYGMTVHGSEEIKAIVKTLKTSTQMGTNVFNFENKISKLFKKKYGIMVNSGTSALFLVFEILNLPKGSEVITPALTFATTVSSMIKNHLVPSLVDVKDSTYCIDVEKIENNITKKTRAICVPNLIGNIAEWDKINNIAKKYNLKIIEDSADTLGGKFLNKPSGHYSDISITSFYGSHVINCAGNGGMLCLNNKEMVNKAKILRSWGRSSSIFKESEKIENRFNIKLDRYDYDSKFVFEELGYNLEPSEIGAAFGLVQLKRLKENIKKRVKFFNLHQNYFDNYRHWFKLPKETRNSYTGWLAYPLIIKKNAPFNRKELQIFLEKRMIQTRVVFTGNILRQPGFKKQKFKLSKYGYTYADDVMRGGLLIACHHGLNTKMLGHLYSSLDSFLKKY